MILGVDPGKSGACVFIDPVDGEIVNYFFNKDIIDKDPSDFCDFLCCNVPDSVFIERVHAMPGQGVTSMFNFGQADGYIKGLISAFIEEFTLVQPRAWKKHFNLLKTDKDSARLLAIKMLEKEGFTPTPDLYKKGKGQALADAYLIAMYGNRH